VSDGSVGVGAVGLVQQNALVLVDEPLLRLLLLDLRHPRVEVATSARQRCAASPSPRTRARMTHATGWLRSHDVSCHDHGLPGTDAANAWHPAPRVTAGHVDSGGGRDGLLLCSALCRVCPPSGHAASTQRERAWSLPHRRARAHLVAQADLPLLRAPLGDAHAPCPLHDNVEIHAVDALCWDGT
jgi:hypothetical protein